MRNTNLPSFAVFCVHLIKLLHLCLILLHDLCTLLDWFSFILYIGLGSFGLQSFWISFAKLWILALKEKKNLQWMFESRFKIYILLQFLWNLLLPLGNKEKNPPTYLGWVESFFKPFLIFAASFFSPFTLDLARLLYPLGDRRLAQSVFGVLSPRSTAVLKLWPPHHVLVAMGCLQRKVVCLSWEQLCAGCGGPACPQRVCGTAGESWASFGDEGGRGDWLCIHHAVQREFQLRWDLSRPPSFLDYVGELFYT